MQVLGGLNDLRKKGHFCDVTLCVDGQTFPVHRSVLASFSPYFRVSAKCCLIIGVCRLNEIIFESRYDAQDTDSN